MSPADRMPQRGCALRGLATRFVALASMLAGAAWAAPQTVYFPAAAGQPELVGYVFSPSAPGPHPAVVLLHGRAGPYSSNVNAGCTTVARGQPSPCGAGSLTRRHMMWGQYWADRGAVALLVDSFGPRGRGHGFGRHTHDDPAREIVNERTVRPLDAEAALAWLVAQPGVDPARVMLQGWSNGASTVLNVLHRQARGEGGRARFAAAIALYPGCGPQALLARKLQLDVPLMLFLAGDDEEVSPQICRDVAERSGGPGGKAALQWFDGATHDFDDPGKARQSVAANRSAKDTTLTQAAAFFGIGR